MSLNLSSRISRAIDEHKFAFGIAAGSVITLMVLRIMPPTRYIASSEQIKELLADPTMCATWNTLMGPIAFSVAP